MTDYVYQVRDWDAHYENYKSREVDECSFVCVPNKQHGMGLTRILAEPDGAAIYGVWNLILGACSRQRRPRNGWLTHDGTEGGTPWSVEDLALRWRMTREEVTRALEFLCSDAVGWMFRHERTLEGSTPAVPVKYPRGTTKGMEGNGREGKGMEDGGTAAARGGTVPASAVLEFPIAHRKGNPETWTLRADYVAELSEAFVGIDVMSEARKALVWVRGKPQRKKTSRGMRSFLFGWMERAQSWGAKRQENGKCPADDKRAAVAAALESRPRKEAT
jgi:hypothetical protein